MYTCPYSPRKTIIFYPQRARFFGQYADDSSWADPSMSSVSPLIAVALAGGPHILSDTPSWLRLRPNLAEYFSADMDLLPPNASSLPRPCGCSGRGSCAGEDGSRCACEPGYTGARCEFVGPAWAMAPQPGLVPKSRAHGTVTAVGEHLYMFGGATYLNGRAHRLNDLHYYTPSTRRWTTPYAVGHWPEHGTHLGDNGCLHYSVDWQSPWRQGP